MLEFIKFHEIPDEIVYRIGRNANQNNQLIKGALIDDILIQLKYEPSAHVLVSLPLNITKKDKKDIIRWGAIFCRKYSNADSKSSVLYTKIKANCFT